jgi:hypothetical protein
MDSESGTGGLDQADHGSRVGPGGRALRNPTIGVIGKSVLTSREKATLTYIGRCIALLGHRLAFIPAKGTADAVREGMAAEGGELLELESDVIGQSDMTWIYPDKRLLSRLLIAYPNLDNHDHAVVIREDQLDEWASAVKQVLSDKDIPHPA